MSISLHHPDSLIGRVIAGYELTDFIDSGASSLVFRGKRVLGAPAPAKEMGALPVTVPDVAAIKLLAPSLGATEEEAADFQRRFEREASVLKQFAHPHILAVIDSGKDADTGYFYMVLPYMEGGSLASALARRGPLPLPEVAAILAQIANALDFAHRHGVIHRDVKPGNILLDAQDAPYLGDFGILRLLANNTTQRTTIGRVMGSPAYMAPEQFSDPSRVGPLSDIYSLGMVVYQMVTGHVAFQTTSWPALIHRQLNEAPASPRSVRHDLPEPAGAAILHALEKNPTDRFPTAAAFAQAFALGAQGRWADGLMEYMAAATMPATTITMPHAPTAAAPMTPALPPKAQRTHGPMQRRWRAGRAVTGAARGAWRRRRRPCCWYPAWRGSSTLAPAAPRRVHSRRPPSAQAQAQRRRRPHLPARRNRLARPPQKRQARMEAAGSRPPQRRRTPQRRSPPQRRRTPQRRSLLPQRRERQLPRPHRQPRRIYRLPCLRRQRQRLPSTHQRIRAGNESAESASRSWKCGLP